MEEYWDSSWFKDVIESKYHMELKGSHDPLKETREAFSLYVFSKIAWSEDGLKFQGVFKKRAFNGAISQEKEDEWKGLIRVDLYRTYHSGKGKVNMNLVQRIRKGLNGFVVYDRTF
ncbi:hypothetical protein HYU07_01750 [Candidatus Woesearchaeota archaeon]|nr:hypothetical protein [Candidatus Woesearchaeota archaeon]